ncbi:hypothetical protein I2486_19110 [Cellulophaga sp. E16_2]|nr:hypothetical protein [Cellulophaga sp. E16_2]
MRPTIGMKWEWVWNGNYSYILFYILVLKILTICKLLQKIIAIAFSNISTGIYKFPKAFASEMA